MSDETSPLAVVAAAVASVSEVASSSLATALEAAQASLTTAAEAATRAASTAAESATGALDAARDVARPVVDKASELANQGLTAVQNGAIVDAAEAVNEAVATRAELTLALAAADALIAPRGATSVVGRAAVFLNGTALTALAVRGARDPAKFWAGVGLALPADAAKALGALPALPLWMLGVAGAGGALAGAVGPENQLLVLVTMAAQKLALALFLVDLHERAAGEQVAALVRHHWRTGAVLLLMAAKLWWGRQRAPAAPRYITDMERRLADRIDKLAAQARAPAPAPGAASEGARPAGAGAPPAASPRKAVA